MILELLRSVRARDTQASGHRHAVTFKSIRLEEVTRKSMNPEKNGDSSQSPGHSNM